MLHRAAVNAYSWWWANHIRTKQLKWLEQNVQDMEEKVEYVLNVINEDGDSFMMKADMFFRRRPELVSFIEDCLHGYRALARRYDKLSMVMQNANRTIASAFPEKMQHHMDDDFDDFPLVTNSSREPKRPQKSVPPPLIAAAAAATQVSGLSRSEALVEIDRLQKGILALQTEKEFVKSSYEIGIAKCVDIEDEVTLMQAKVYLLQDEFGVEKAIEDDEARMLMAATALNSCQEKITNLRDKQEKSMEEAKGESKKLDKVRDKFEIMVEQLRKDNSENESVRETKKLQNSDQNTSIEEEINNLGMVNVSLKEQLQVDGDSTLTVTILADKIDELVDTVINLESAISSQGAVVKRLRSESNELQEKLRSLEVDKETLTGSSDHKNEKIRDLESQLQILQSKQCITNQDKNSQNMKDGRSSINSSYDKFQNVESREPPREVSGVNYMSSPNRNYRGDPRSEEEVQKDENHDRKVLAADVRKDENRDSKVLAAEPNLQVEQGNNHVEYDNSMQKLKMKGNEKNKNSQNKLKDGSSSFDNLVDKVQKVESPHRNHIGNPGADEEAQKDENHDRKVLAAEPELQSKQGNNHLDNHSMQELKMKGNEKEHEPLSMMDDSDALEYGTVEEHLPNWRHILRNDLEDREKLLMEEYTSLLKNFKQVKKKLNDSEKKHRANLFKSTLQMKVLKNANASKDAEIQSLHKKLNLSQSEHDVRNTNKSSEADHRQVSDTSSYDILERQVETIRTEESTVAAQTNDNKTYDRGEMELASAISSIEEKIRMDLDELLEDNIDFWLKYSTSFYQVEKFQTTFEDLQAELTELNKSKKQERSTLQHSDVRPIYMHLREMQTELTLWLEQNVVLEDDLETRISSIYSIQEEISRSSNADSVASDDTELTDYQAAKFTGEVMSMKHQNNKVADELLDGIERVKRLKVKIKNAVAELDKEFGFSAAKDQHAKQSRSKVPLRSFLFGSKLKKQKKGSLLAQSQQSDACKVQPTS
ncbi:NAB domain-containing protein [Heracleum sosnowskyi]|uniref:NAB domain-containing protein n=1 Tax=Heracleum sosnowskyi TaxID=360622 RepID=A0AAD8IWL7_9APIA|nr:NAB domain-containing protein [Heracleum sosnowskyi]